VTAPVGADAHIRPAHQSNEHKNVRRIRKMLRIRLTFLLICPFAARADVGIRSYGAF
jgi:hypothetical protein